MNKIPLYYVRGGTSSGVIIQKKDLPNEKEKINEIVRKIFGVPRYGNQKNNKYQIEGIGKGISTSNKCFIIDIDIDIKTISSTFLQLESTSNHVSWDVNCGNMTTAIPLVLEDLRLLKDLSVDGKIKIYNTNTNKIIYCQLPQENNQQIYCTIPGVENKYPEVDISFKDPEGSLTDGVFPTGKKIDIIDEIEVTCIDAIVPMVIIDGESLGINGNEGRDTLIEMDTILRKIESIRIKAGVMMKIKNSGGGIMSYEEIMNSITTPKVAIVNRGEINYDISVIYLTPKEIHSSIAVSGGSCVSYACSVLDTIASRLFNGNEVRIKHFSGVSEFGLKKAGNKIEVYTKRNAQIYMKGEFYIY